jgi:hypothetical protein
MKKYTATVVSTLVQEVSIEVPDDISHEDLMVALCNAAVLPDGDFESEAYDIRELV